MKTKDMCKTAIVAAVYVVLTMINPASFGVVQLRISNMLCVLPFFNKKYSPGILLGIAMANATSPIGLVDVIFGVSAEGVAYALCAYGPLKHTNLGCKVAVLSVCVALVIGAELTLVYQTPYIVTATGLFVGTAIVATAGVLIIKAARIGELLGE